MKNLVITSFLLNEKARTKSTCGFGFGLFGTNQADKVPGSVLVFTGKLIHQKTDFRFSC